MTRTRAQRDGHYLLLLGAVFFLLFGALLVAVKPDPLEDLKTAYYRGVCLHERCDPYDGNAIEILYARAGEPPFPSDRNRLVVTRNIYLPSEFPFVATLALLPLSMARILWILLIGSSFLWSSYLVWRSASASAPILSACLVAFCLGNSGSLFYFGNPAGFVVPLIIISVCCFLHDKWATAGIFCLAISVAFKPHDGVLVWMFFLLAGCVHRRRALWTLALTVAIGLPGALWADTVSPHWLSELSSNLRVLSGPGSVTDPSFPHGTLVLTNLQTVTSFFWANPHAYDLASYLVCAPLFLILGLTTLRVRPTATAAWLAMAAIAPLSMLPVYHRQYDAKLILLAVPACALLWARRDRVGWLAVIVTSVAFVLNGDLPWVVFLASVNHFHPASAGPYGRLLTAFWDFPVPISLLAMAGFYLWAYAKFARSADFSGNRAGRTHLGNGACRAL